MGRIADGKIVHIVENAQPNDDLDREVYRADRAVDFVLEVKAWTVREKGMEVGDAVEVEGG